MTDRTDLIDIVARTLWEHHVPDANLLGELVADAIIEVGWPSRATRATDGCPWPSCTLPAGHTGDHVLYRGGEA